MGKLRQLLSAACCLKRLLLIKCEGKTREEVQAIIAICAIQFVIYFVKLVSKPLVL